MQYPDCLSLFKLKDIRVIEFEYESANFQSHVKHQRNQDHADHEALPADCIVCWQSDKEELNLSDVIVVELQEILKKLTKIH